MKTELQTQWTVKDICEGFVYNELEGKGLYGMDGISMLTGKKMLPLLILY